MMGNASIYLCHIKVQKTWHTLMTHNLIPIRFRFLKLPVVWTADVSTKHGPVICGQLQKWKSSPEEIKITELEGWQLRDELFSLPDDIVALTRFLNKVGVWSSDPESASFDWSRYPLHVQVNDVRRFRDELKDALIYQKEFAGGIAPPLKKAKTLLDLMTPHPANNFPLRFELSEVAAGAVTLTNARQMLFATVLTDVARGIHFKTCKRKDCQKPFPVESGHKRDYCGQYCGHLESVRRNRAKKPGKRKVTR
jgi:hypothetical protein